MEIEINLPNKERIVDSPLIRKVSLGVYHSFQHSGPAETIR